jgi:DNA polymerase I-like protein with 3'-5' exonuclease and polymerase domains
MPKAPKIWEANGEDILNPLKLWEKWHDNPRKYQDMKVTAREMRKFLNNGKNFQIQSLAASITNRACIAIARELKRKGIKGHVCAQIHDQIVVRVPKAMADKWRKTVQFQMENVYKLSIPLKAPAEIAHDFYEGH